MTYQNMRCTLDDISTNALRSGLQARMRPREDSTPTAALLVFVADFVLLGADGADDGGHQIVEGAARRKGAAAEGIGIELLFGAGQQQTFRIGHREVQCDVGGSNFGRRGVDVASR